MKHVIKILLKEKFPLVSIVIPALNSGKTIEKTLLSIEKQTYPHVEVIVADGGSKDKTVLIVKKYKAKVCFAKELGRARYEGLKKSRGKFILALDSDQFLGIRTIEKCVHLMFIKKYDALILHEESVVRKGTIVEKLLAYDKLIINSAKDINPVFGASIPRFFRRTELLKLKWPKTLSILDDAVLHKEFIKNNKKIGFVPGFCIRHYEVDSWRLFFKKFIRYGKLYLPTMRVSPKTTMVHSFPRRAYFTQNAFSKPILLLGLFFLYAVKAIAVITGIVLYIMQENVLQVGKKKNKLY